RTSPDPVLTPPRPPTMPFGGSRYDVGTISARRPPMPIHDWTRVSAGGFHNFHQDWTIEIYRALNRGLLPPGFTAYTDLRAGGWEPDVVTIQTQKPTAVDGGTAVAIPP